MARPLSWSDVRGGLIACLVIGLLAAVTLRYARVGALHGDTFRMFALVGEARGVMKGSDVWLSGQRIGRIVDIRLRPPQTADTARRVQIEMEVMEQYRPALRRDAVAQIRAGGSVIGPPVVYLSPGTVRAGALQPGDTVHAEPQSDVEGATAQFSGAAREFPLILADLKVLSAQLRSTDNTIGALMNGPSLGDGELQRTRVLVSRLGARLHDGHGTADAVMGGDLALRARRVMARADSVRALLSSSSSSLGRLRRDSTLVGEVDDIRNELTLVRAHLDAPDGTVGRAMQDSALGSALGAAEREMSLLFADLKKHPFRYLSF